jgi:HEAT repeat protein
MFAAGILGRLRDPSVVSPLIELLGHDDINVVQAAIDSLAQLRAPAAVGALLGVLERDPWLRFAAVHALGRVGHPSAVKALLPLVEEEGIADAAIDALGEIGSAEALERLAVLLRRCADSDAFVGCLRAVGRLLQRQPNEDRLRAVATWSALAGEEASPIQLSLLKVLSDQGAGAERESKEAATAVVRALRMRGLYGALVKVARDPTLWDVARFSAMCIGNEIEPALAVGLSHPDPFVRRFACLCAGMLRLESLAVQIEPMLSDPDEGARATAIEALGRMSHLPALPQIARALDDESDGVHVAAVVALSRADAAAATRALMADLPRSARAMRGALETMRANPHPDQKSLIDVCLAAADPAIRRRAVAALAVQVTVVAIEELVPILEDPSVDVRREVLQALACWRHPRARDALVKQLADDPDTRADAVRALGELGDPGATPMLVRHYDGAAPVVRLAILDALAELGEPSAEPLLVRQLDDADCEVRRSAVLALGRLGTRTALTYLTAAARDSQWEVRAAVTEALGGDIDPALKATLERLSLDPNALVAARARRRLEELEDA